MRAKPKKSLGQNFLVDGNIRRKIVAACGFTGNDIVLEVGSGSAQMTPLIAERVKKLYAVEIDRRLIDPLTEKTKAYPNVNIINADILKFDLNSIPLPAGSRIKVFGNIPYYITTPIIERVFDFRDIIIEAYLLVQKEFCRRITAASGGKEYGSFSCFVQYYSKAESLFDVKKNSFYPVPKVDSSLLKLSLKREAQLKPEEEELLFKIIRAGFNKRRKTLRNSLKGVIEEEKLERFFKTCGFKSDIRPEQLSLGDFQRLALS